MFEIPCAVRACETFVSYCVKFANTCIAKSCICICTGVPVYLAPWTACPPGASCPGISYPRPGHLHPRGQAVQAGLSCSPPIQRKFCCVMFTIICNTTVITCSSCYKYVNLNDYFKGSVGFLNDKGWGASCPGWSILPPPPPRFTKRKDNQQFLLHHLLQEY